MPPCSYAFEPPKCASASAPPFSLPQRPASPPPPSSVSASVNVWWSHGAPFDGRAAANAFWSNGVFICMCRHPSTARRVINTVNEINPNADCLAPLALCTQERALRVEKRLAALSLQREARLHILDTWRAQAAARAESQEHSAQTLRRLAQARIFRALLVTRSLDGGRGEGREITTFLALPKEGHVTQRSVARSIFDGAYRGWRCLSLKANLCPRVLNALKPPFVPVLSSLHTSLPSPAH